MLEDTSTIPLPAGWRAQPLNEGTLQLRRAEHPQTAAAITLLAFSLFGWGFFAFMTSIAVSFIKEGMWFAVVFSLFSLGFALLPTVAGLWMLRGEETWRIGPNLLEVRRSLLGLSWTTRYTDRTLRIAPALPESAATWALTLEAAGGKTRSVLVKTPWIEVIEPLAAVLAERTGWPLHVPEEALSRPMPTVPVDVGTLAPEGPVTLANWSLSVEGDRLIFADTTPRKTHRSNAIGIVLGALFFVAFSGSQMFGFLRATFMHPAGFGAHPAGFGGTPPVFSIFAIAMAALTLLGIGAAVAHSLRAVRRLRHGGDVFVLDRRLNQILRNEERIARADDLSHIQLNQITCGRNTPGPSSTYAIYAGLRNGKPVALAEAPERDEMTRAARLAAGFLGVELRQGSEMRAETSARIG